MEKGKELMQSCKVNRQVVPLRSKKGRMEVVEEAIIIIANVLNAYNRSGPTLYILNVLIHFILLTKLRGRLY